MVSFSLLQIVSVLSMVTLAFPSGASALLTSRSAFLAALEGGDVALSHAPSLLFHFSHGTKLASITPPRRLNNRKLHASNGNNNKSDNKNKNKNNNDLDSGTRADLVRANSTTGDGINTKTLVELDIEREMEDKGLLGNVEWRRASVVHAAAASGDPRVLRMLVEGDPENRYGVDLAEGEKDILEQVIRERRDAEVEGETNAPESQSPEEQNGYYNIDNDGKVKNEKENGNDKKKEKAKKSRAKSWKRIVRKRLKSRFDIKGPLMLSSATIYHAASLVDRGAEVAAIVRRAVGPNTARELVNVASAEGFDPLTVCAELDHKATMIELIDTGAAILPEERDRRELSKGFPMHPIHVAASGGHTEIVQTLIARGVPVDLKAFGGRGDTSLHGAAQNGHEDLVEALIQLGADVHVRSADGRFPIDLANDAGHEHVVTQLKDFGANNPLPDPHALTAEQMRQIRKEDPNAEFEKMPKGANHIVVETPKASSSTKKKSKVSKTPKSSNIEKDDL